MTPSSPEAMRAALESRINARATADRVDPGRVRRRLVFQRLVRRLAVDDSWVLKGAYLLETRLGVSARTTKDLDLASSAAEQPGLLQDAIEDLLATDPDGDFLRFAVRRVVAGTPAETAPALRVSITASLAGRPFDHVRLDVAPRVAEVAGATETLTIPCPVSGLSLSSAVVHAVDVAQHAAEKFHALCRTYAGGRPSTRVKDLLDIVLLVEAGLLPHPALGSRLRAVFTMRDGAVPPAGLPEPPASWLRDYAALLVDTAAATTDLTAAHALADDTYRIALTENDKEPG